MVDPSAIVGLISACVSLADTIYHYTSSFKDAPKCVADLSAEISAIQTVLKMLRDHLQQESHKSGAFDRTSVLFFAGDGCKKRLESLETKLLPSVSESKLIRFLRRSKWPLDEDDTIKEVEALQRYVQLFNFALTIEGFTMLSATQSDALVQLQTKLDTVIVSAGAQSNSTQTTLHEIRDTVRVLPQMVSVVESISNKVGKLNIDAERTLLLNSLPSLPFDEKHRDLQLRRTSGLGQWLLNMREFKALCDGSAPEDSLWCYGAPGAGKTFLTSIVIDYLESMAPQKNFRVIYLYFDYREQSEQTPFKVVSCLLKQVLLSCNRVPAAAAGLCRRLKEGKGLPGWEELTQILSMFCSEFDNLVFVFDALDESDENTNREPILRVLDSLISSPAKLFVTSRPHCLDIKATFRECPQIQVEATDADVRAFVDRRISESRRMSTIINGALREEIVLTIVGKSQGMFLLPALQIGNILSQTNENEVRQALRELPSGLVRNLDLAIERIKNQDSQSQTRASLAIRTLNWLSHAQRTLTVSELQHALATKSGMDRFDPKNLTDSTFLIESCLGLVTVDQETSVIRLVHLSVNEYIQERHDDLFPHGHKRLAMNCLDYLMLQNFQLTAPPVKQVDLDKLTNEYPFIGYASTYWGQHASKQFDLDIEELTRTYLTRENSVQLSIQLVEMEAEWKTLPWNRDRDNVSVFIVKDVSLLHIASRFGIEKLAEEVLQSSSDPNPRDSWNRTPLMLAAAYGHNVLVQKLMRSQAIEINSTDSSGITALGAAVKYNQLETVRILLSSSTTDINLGGPFFEIQSLWYPEAGRAEIAELFLSRPDLDVNAIGKSERPIWHMLMNDFNFELLQLLLSRNDLDPSKILANTDSLSERMRDAFNYALNSDLETAEDLISLFLIWCAIEGDARFPTPENAMLQLTWPILYYSLTWTPQHDDRGYLEIATYNIWNPSTDHRDKITECLKSQGLHTLTLKDSRERGFLHYVATLDNNEYVSYLLLHGADASARDSSGRTPLHAALKAGIESNARLLLESGANVSAVDSQNRSPLYCALESGHESFALLLLDNGAKASTADSDRWSALHWAAKKGCEEAVRRLLREGVDASTGDVSGWTPLHAAADSTSDASIRIVQVLLNHGADPDAADVDDWTPVHAAANEGTLQVLEHLAKRTGRINHCSMGCTALHRTAWSMDLDKARVLIQHGGDMNALDCYGRSSWDWFSIHSPFFESLKSSAAAHSPREPAEAKSRLMDCFAERVEHLLKKLDDPELYSYAFRAGRQLLCLGDDDSARILFGVYFGHVKNRPGGTMWNETCHNCKINHSTARFVCRVCAMFVLCSECYLAQKMDKFPWCKGHSFLEISNTGWMKFPTGVINASGQNLEEFLKDLRRKYFIAASDES